MNLDTMDFDELDAIRRGVIKLFPSKPPHYVRTASFLAIYASDRLLAMRYLADGHIKDALKVEEELKKLYDKLPEYSRW